MWLFLGVTLSNQKVKPEAAANGCLAKIKEKYNSDTYLYTSIVRHQGAIQRWQLKIIMQCLLGSVTSMPTDISGNLI